jgi:hypothetical protein
MGKEFFFQSLNVREVCDVRWKEMHRAEPIVFEPNPFKVEIVIAKLKNYKSASSDQIRQNWFKQEVNCYEQKSINILIIFGIKNNFPITERSPLLYHFTRMAIKLVIINVDIFLIDQLLASIFLFLFFSFFCNIQILEKNMGTMRQYISYS